MGEVILYSAVGMLSVLGLYTVVAQAVLVFRPSAPHTSAVIVRSREDAGNLDILLCEVGNSTRNRRNEHIVIVTDRRFAQEITDTGLVERYRAELIIAEEIPEKAKE